MFLAYLNQGQGCDYTIGCGFKIIQLEAGTHEEALKELQEKIVGQWNEDDKRFYEGYTGESALETATLYDVSNITCVPIEKWYKEAREQEEYAKNKVNEQNEKKELQRLKKKYE